MVLFLNLAELRLYFYMKSEDLYENTKVLTYPVGIGRLDWKTPLGETLSRVKSRIPRGTLLNQSFLSMQKEGRFYQEKLRRGRIIL